MIGRAGRPGLAERPARWRSPRRQARTRRRRGVGEPTDLPRGETAARPTSAISRAACSAGKKGCKVNGPARRRRPSSSASTPTATTSPGRPPRLRRDDLLAPGARAARGEGRRLFDLCDAGDAFEVRRLRPHARRPARRSPPSDRLPAAVHAAPKVPVEVTASDRIDLPLGVGQQRRGPSRRSR